LWAIIQLFLPALIGFWNTAVLPPPAPLSFIRARRSETENASHRHCHIFFETKARRNPAFLSARMKIRGRSCASVAGKSIKLRGRSIKTFSGLLCPGVPGSILTRLLGRNNAQRDPTASFTARALVKKSKASSATAKSRAPASSSAPKPDVRPRKDAAPAPDRRQPGEQRCTTAAARFRRFAYHAEIGELISPLGLYDASPGAARTFNLIVSFLRPRHFVLCHRRIDCAISIYQPSHSKLLRKPSYLIIRARGQSERLLTLRALIFF
jgi:hypothetical protein